MSRIGLYGLMSSFNGLLEPAAVKMSECQRVKGSEGPRIERTKSYRSLAPFDRSLGLTGPRENDTPKDIGKSR